MKKKILLVIVLFVCTCLFVNNSEAKEKKFKRQDMGYTYSEKRFDVSPMYVTGDGRIQYIWYRYKTDKNDNSFAEINRDLIEGKGIKTISSIKDPNARYYGIFSEVRMLNDKILTSEKKNSKVVIKEYNENGKKIFTFKDKNEYSWLRGWDNGRNIYYTYGSIDHEEDYVYNIRCIKKKNKKAGDVGSFKLTVQDLKRQLGRDEIKIEKEKIYVLCNEKINIYSLKGKMLNTCKLPGGDRDIIMNEGTEEQYSLTFNHFSVYGDYVYYCNRTGIYRWKTTGKRGFKLYYDANGDEYFGSGYGAADICVSDKDTIYIMLTCSVGGNIGELSKIVRYTR